VGGCFVILTDSYIIFVDGVTFSEIIFHSCSKCIACLIVKLNLKQSILISDTCNLLFTVYPYIELFIMQDIKYIFIHSIYAFFKQSYTIDSICKLIFR